MTEIPSREVWCMSCGETAADNDRDPDRFAETHTEADCPAGEPVIQRGRSQDELLEVARDAGMPVQDEVKTVGKCANPNCDEELPDKGPKKMNLGVDSGYCGLACMLEDEDE